MDELGGEAGVLALAVELAAANGRTGQEPFAALVVRDGVVIGTGVNAQSATVDPTAHAEVAAIRDAARRTGTADLTGAVVVSSCEPCPMCRTTAWSAGIAEVVFAAPASAVPDAIAGDRTAGARLAAAIADAIPGLVRPGAADDAAAAAVFDPWR
ncbi:nucleoside deaminase [Cellulomonas sp. APG4]|nr:nucleoside deaminase [Cellulomonas sp. APG4]